MPSPNQVLAFRARAGLTQTELAKRAGLAAPSLSRIETGRSAGHGATKVRIADALGADLDDVFPRAKH